MDGLLSVNAVRLGASCWMVTHASEPLCAALLKAWGAGGCLQQGESFYSMASVAYLLALFVVHAVPCDPQSP